MENQHRKISGYRELSQTEIDLMNEIKALGPQIEAVTKKVRTHLDGQYGAEKSDDEATRLYDADPYTWLNRAVCDLQDGLMKLTRSVAQPTFF